MVIRIITECEEAEQIAKAGRKADGSLKSSHQPDSRAAG